MTVKNYKKPNSQLYFRCFPALTGNDGREPSKNGKTGESGFLKFLSVIFIYAKGRRSTNEEKYYKPRKM